jgi:hypothetical protein
MREAHLSPLYMANKKTRNKSLKNRKRQNKKSRKNRRIIGGNNGECPICLEDKELLTIVHNDESSSSTRQHQICKECFNRLSEKICPLCRVDIKMLIDSNNNIIFPQPPPFADIMTTYFNARDDISRVIGKGGKPCVLKFDSWAACVNNKNIELNMNGTKTPLFPVLIERLSEFPTDQLTHMYKSFFTNHIPIFNQVVDKFIVYAKNHMNSRTINKNIFKIGLADETKIKQLLAYTIMVEVAGQRSIEEYIQRIIWLFDYRTN